MSASSGQAQVSGETPQCLFSETIRLSDKHPSTVNVTFTGGLDSTFTMVCLSRFDLTIQPYYVRCNRQSIDHELKSIAAICEDIQKHSQTKCKILPLQISNFMEIEPDAEITAAWKRLRAAIRIGRQYDWLARLGKSVDALMINVENSQNNKLLRCIKKFGCLTRIEEGELSYCKVDANKSHQDLVSLLGHLRFPLPLLETTKLQAWDLLNTHGYQGGAAKTWFCHSPIDGASCGVCSPCTCAIDDGMTWRFNDDALKRYDKSKRKWRRHWKWLRGRVEASVATVLDYLGLLNAVKRVLGRS
jgi:7-cyano-7-deazaguanine synthase in queuosine biosynthesis